MAKTIDTVFDYLKWRKDLSFKDSPFNEIDALILARFSYLPFDGLIDYAESEITISEACKYLDSRKELVDFGIEGDSQLVIALQDNRRFGDLKFGYYKNHIDSDRVKQFSAISIFIDERTTVVSYRGTDNSIVGWKEDFLMTFSDTIPSQKEAREYLSDIARKRHGKFIVVGHSKGGNLAMYAASFSPNVIKNRILKVYSFDGPGFDHQKINSKRYLNSVDKIVSYIPQTSIVGVMLEHKEEIRVIHSDAFGPMQHDVYTWEVDITKLKYLETNTTYSSIMDMSFENYINSLTTNQRKEFVDILFEIVEASGVATFKDLQANFIKVLPSVIERISKLDKESSKALLEGIKVLVSSIANNTGEEFMKNISNYGEEAKETITKILAKFKNSES